jgi:putative phage-type endonuclease
MKQVSFPTQSGSPDSDAWHAWRGAHLGASDAPIIAAGHSLCSKPSWARSIHVLWMEKTGQIARPASNMAMARGRKYEEPARMAYEEATGEVVSPVFGECEPFPELSASFDGMSLDSNTIVEIKVPSQKVHQMAKNNQVVDYYVPQLAHQALVAWGHPELWGSGKRVRFVTYDPDHADLAIVDVDLGEVMRMAKAVLPKLLDFWKAVVERRPPMGEDLEPLAVAYLEVQQRLDDVKGEQDALRAQLIELAEKKGGRAEGYGVSVARAVAKGTIDYAKAAETLGIDFEPFRKEPRTSWYVKVQANKGGSGQTA